MGIIGAAPGRERRGDELMIRLPRGEHPHYPALMAEGGWLAMAPDQRQCANKTTLILQGKARLVLGRAVTWIRGFVNNFLRVPLACLGSSCKTAVELSRKLLTKPCVRPSAALCSKGKGRCGDFDDSWTKTGSLSLFLLSIHPLLLPSIDPTSINQHPPEASRGRGST